MKMKYAFILTTVALSFIIGYAKPSIVSSDTAKAFLHERYSKASRINFFIADIDEKSDNTLMEMKNLLVGSYTVYASRNKSFRIKKENVLFDLSNLEKERSLCARNMLMKLLPQKYVNQFKLVSIDTQRSFAKSQGVKVEGYTFNFKRLFENRIVRNKENYLIVQTDENGVLRNAEIALQDLSVSSERITVDADYNEKVATLDSLLDVDYKFVNIVDENKQVKQIELDEIEIGSVADSYCEVQVGSEKRLIPCLSYASKLIFPNKDEVGGIIDVPYSRASWSEYSKSSSATFIHHR